MIKIKDYIFNENEIEFIEKIYNGLIVCPKAVNVNIKEIKNATFEDIEWNYCGTFKILNEEEQLKQNSIKFYSKTLEELEEENEKLKEDLEAEKSINSYLSRRILKAIEYIENDMPYLEEPDEEFEKSDGTTYMTMKEYDTSILLKILKGEENE